MSADFGPLIKALMGRYETPKRLRGLRLGEGALRSYTPTLRERVAGTTRDYWPFGNKEQKVHDLMGLVDWSPPGMLMDMYDSGRMGGEGNYLGAGLTAGFAASPGPAGKLASKAQMLYIPIRKPQRDFAVDYPRGATSDEAGRLTADIEGRPLIAERVVGRTMVGGHDEALPAAQLLPLAEALVGNPVARSPSRLLRGDAGRFQREIDSLTGERISRITLDKNLTEQQAPRVLAHEIGHAIDEIAGQISASGLTKELDFNDSALATGQERQRHLTLPQHLGYSSSEAPREKIVEAIRAYMTDPNYLKTVAPRANPAKVEDFGDKDLLQDIDLARILFGEVIPLRRDAR